MDEGLEYLRQKFPRPGVPTGEDPARGVPSSYLDPRRRVVGFFHRPEYDRLLDWCRGDTPERVRLVHGPGGTGKTRLAVELISVLAEEDGWTAGWLTPQRNEDPERLADALKGRRALLCVDGAETSAAELPGFLDLVSTRLHEGVRVLLLARTAGVWWDSLAADDSRLRPLLGENPLTLRQLGAREEDREEILARAYQDFRARICDDAPAVLPPVHGGVPAESSVLDLHAAALTAVLHARDHKGRLPEQPVAGDPLKDLLRYERAWWQHWGSGDESPLAHTTPDLTPRDFSGRVLLVPALYLAADQRQAVEAVTKALPGGLSGPGPADRVARSLAGAYPDTRSGGPRFWGPIQPDGLGETLVGEVLEETGSDEECTTLIGDFLAGTGEQLQAEHALTVLARVAGLTRAEGGAAGPAEVGRRRAGLCIAGLLRKDPQRFLTAATAVAVGLADPEAFVEVVKPAVSAADEATAERSIRMIKPGAGPLAGLELALWRRCLEAVSERRRSAGGTAADGRFDVLIGSAWSHVELAQMFQESGDAESALIHTINVRKIYQDLNDPGEPHKDRSPDATSQNTEALAKYGGPRPDTNDPDLSLVFPVGFFVGPLFTSRAEEPESFDIRFLDGVFSVGRREYAVWATAHGDPQLVGVVPTTRAVVEHQAELAGVNNPGEVFDRVLADGLVVDIPPTGEKVREFAVRHQVMPLALGLGNTPQQLGGFQMGMPNAPRATVGHDIYHLWMFAHRHGSLWEAVEVVARDRIEAEPGSTATPEDLLEAFIQALPVLMATSCAYIDRVD